MSSPALWSPPEPQHFFQVGAEGRERHPPPNAGRRMQTHDDAEVVARFRAGNHSEAYSVTAANGQPPRAKRSTQNPGETRQGRDQVIRVRNYVQMPPKGFQSTSTASRR